jgi:tetratricopeptide (TPR) repeat protein
MEDRTLGIIGGIALFLALLSPLVMESRTKIEKLYTEAEALHNRNNFKDAIEKYTAAYNESKKLGTKTNHIDKDFPTLVNYKIAMCYYELGEITQDTRHYMKAQGFIKKSLTKTKVNKHKGNLTFLDAKILYKTGKFEVAKSKLLQLEMNFPNFHWIPELFYTIGDIYNHQEKYDKALEYFEKLIEKYPNSKFSSLAEGRMKKIIPKPHDNGPKPPEPPLPEWEKKAKKYLENANTLKDQNKFDEAMELYKQLIRQFPDSQFVSNAHEGRGDIYFVEKNYLDARANYEEAIYSTNDAERKTMLYEKYHRTFLVPTLVKPDPSDPIEELYREAIHLRESRKYLKAAEKFEQLVNFEQTYADKSHAFLEAAKCYHIAYKYNGSLFSKSVDALQKLIEKHSESPYSISAYYYLAWVYWDQAIENGMDKTHFQLVIKTVDKTNKKYKNSEDDLTKDLLKRLNKLKENASHHINSAPKPTPSPDPKPKIDPAPRPLVEHEIRLVDKGYIHFNKNELDEAIKIAREALDINPNYQRAKELKTKVKNEYFKNGTEFLNKFQFEKSIVEFRKALKIDPEFEKAYCNLGVVYIYMERYNDAINELNKATNIDSKFKEAHFNLGLAYYELDRFEDAKNAVHKALQIEPDYDLAKILMDSIIDKLE